ncbi:MAG: hypothetical protein HOP29_08015 [Phycisphaerales bacterium]|nr:hypothetical protein [Phycisphaerales bacterium]
MSLNRAFIVGALAIVVGSVLGLIESTMGAFARRSAPGGAIRVPWEVIVPLLLVGSLSVIYFVFQRRIQSARNASELSPLGQGGRVALIDGKLYLKVLGGVEALLAGVILSLPMIGRTWSAPDIGRVLGAGAIVAFIAHLLAMARRAETEF